MTGTPMRDDNPHARRICGAMTRMGSPCKGQPMANGRCRMHGGATPAGLGLPQFKTGRYSKYLPARLADRYHEAAQDPELLALRDDIALLDSRLAELVQRVDTGESSQFWESFKKAIRAYSKVRGVRDRDKGDAAWGAVLDVLADADQDYSAWAEVISLIDLRSKLSERERKRLSDMQQMMTNEQAMTLLGAVAGVIRKHVHDRDTLAAITADLRAISAVPDRRSA